MELLADLNPGPASAIPSFFGLYPSGGSMFFDAFTPGVGIEPWVSDGTAAATRLVGDLAPGSDSSILRDVASTSHGTLLTSTTPSLEAGSYWSTTTTGAAEGDLTSLWSSPGLSTDAARLGGDALVLASDFEQPAVLWRTDGTPGDPEVLVDDLILGIDLVPAGDHAFFLDGQNPLMVTDGTPGGTRQVRRWADGPTGSTVVWRMTALDHRVVFEVHARYQIGGELWVSDGTKKGTRLLRDIRPGLADSGPRHLIRSGGLIYFVANDGRHGREVWRTDGTAAGTRRVSDIAAQVRGLQVCGGSLMFVGVDKAGAALWTSDGSRGSERQVATLPGASGRRAPQDLNCLPGGIAFTGHDGKHGREVWTLGKGAKRPTLHDIRPGPESSLRSFLERAGRELYFVADDGIHGREIWTVNF